MQLVMKRLWPERNEIKILPSPEEPDLDLSKLSQEELDALEQMALLMEALGGMRSDLDAIRIVVTRQVLSQATRGP